MVETGALRGSNAGAADEVAMLWFSANQKWEPTATKVMSTPQGVVPLTFKQQVEKFGAIRFGLATNDSRLMDWSASCAAAGMSNDERKVLEARGRLKGANPAHWFATAHAIPLAELHFQVWTGRWSDATSPQDMATAWTEARAD
jgi:hypothetical protein